MSTQTMPKFKHAHMIAVGGVGMSGLAAVIAQMGYRVSGSDLKIAPVRDRLSSLGVELFEGHDARNLGDADLVVASAAVPDDNPELVAARAKGITVLSRAQMLGRLMSRLFGIAVSGTHGKTTTTSMLAQVLERGGLDPTVLIGGDLDILNGNARLGKSRYFLTEACEAYDSFLELHPAVAVVTNIEAEHLDHYGSLDNVMAAFRRFLSQVQPGGFAALCSDCPNARLIAPSVKARLVTYGLEPGADYHAVEVDVSTPEATFSVVHDGKKLGRVALKVTGRHNVQNALAVVAVADQLKIGFNVISGALSEFHGAGRRFEVLGTAAGITVVDDYAHHPTEIRATISAARAWGRRIIAVFQPHLYSRTQQFAREFAESLSEADEVVVTEIYAAREKPVPGVTAAEIVRLTREQASRTPARFVADKARIAEDLLPELRPGDLVLFMGAGDIREAGEELLAQLASPSHDEGQIVSAVNKADVKHTSELPAIRGEITLGEPMSKHTSLGVGGPAEIFAVAQDPEDVRSLIRWARERSMPVLVIGAGTNLLVSDRGLRGMVIRLGSGFDRVHVCDTRITAGAALRLPALVKAAVDAGLSGLEGLAGIPGSVGGAVFANAGTPAGEVKDTLVSVRAVDAAGRLVEVPRDDLGLAYRSSSVAGQGLIILEATFDLRPGEPAQISRTVQEYAARRKEKQPSGVRTCGSVFKNPPGDYAGRLLEEAVPRGMSVGGASVSKKHANWIENSGGASASDIRELIARLQKLVEERFGIRLEAEVQIVGEW